MNKVVITIGIVLILVSAAIVWYSITGLDSELSVRTEKAATLVAQAGSASGKDSPAAKVTLPNPDINPIASRVQVWGELIEVIPPPPPPPAAPKPPNLEEMIEGLKVESSMGDGKGNVTSMVIYDKTSNKRDLYTVKSKVRDAGLTVDKLTATGAVLRYKETEYTITLPF